MTITQVKLSLLGCLILAAAVSFDVAGQTSGAQGDIDKIQHLIAEYAKAVDTADVMLVREIWSNSPVSTTPTIWYARGGSPLSIRLPITFGSRGQKVRAMIWLTITTPGAFSVSRSLKSRPCKSRIPMVRK